MDALFLGMGSLLIVGAAYWSVGRGTPRPTGTCAMSALLTAFALAFFSYAPSVQNTVESAVPHVARLLSNVASVCAATAVLAVIFQLDLEPVEARGRIRRRLLLLAASVAAMTALFAAEEALDRPRLRALYLLVFVSHLGFAAMDFLLQAVRQSQSARRASVRVGLRIAAVGCLSALVYVAYKVVRLVSTAVGVGLVHHTECSSLVSGTCAFSVTAPALAVLLIGVGFTLPAIAYPISHRRRIRWETRSLAALEPLWHDMTAVMPHIVLDDSAFADDSDYLLHRRVVEISDGILALRPYRSRAVRESAERIYTADTDESAAAVEAALVRAALAAFNAELPPVELAPPSPRALAQTDLRGEAKWLVLVARAYNRQSGPVADDGEPRPVGA
ncbi:MAB_1171c family putative transporter [Streptomyces evansiae]|uniref:MAB_1171c family putative transporter n=1 Tax=Streptomyces evansiae TaxID=3075535 RepID=UPI002886C73C|nr:MAB_1171c family putative transporter [Streptomyces sp. DSM 41859]MDT0424287.1 MAB_1171c family putative transporter [Streptomyces sp. DSM 41859]